MTTSSTNQSQPQRPRPRVYIAGPMRGIREWNFPAFDRAEVTWKEAGWQPFSPAQTCRALGYALPDGEDPTATVDVGHLKHVMSIDVACILAADALAVLPGWESSTGATVEVALAQFLRLPTYDAVTLVEVHPVVRPWSAVGASRLEASSEGKIEDSPKTFEGRPLEERTDGDWEECWRRMGVKW